MQKYYVSHATQQMGPYSVDEIVNFVSEGTLSPLDYIYDEAKGDWFLFLDYPLLEAKVKNLKPKAPPQAQKSEPEKHKVKKPSYEQKTAAVIPTLSEPMKLEWFVLKGDNKFGPFAYTDVVKMLQQGAVFEFDFAWHEGAEGWKRIAEIPAFASDKLRLLKESALPEISAVFFRRRYRRVKYGGTILIHDNKSVWKGRAVEISEGGAGIVMENAMILPGQELFLHFKPGDGVPSFNAICEVVSKQYVSQLSDRNAPVRYGLKFKTVNTETQKFLHDYTRKSAA